MVSFLASSNEWLRSGANSPVGPRSVMRLCLPLGREVEGPRIESRAKFGQSECNRLLMWSFTLRVHELREY